jgi:predicted ribosome quality control (RQC) complex YloA/Tae2 family protein
MPGWPGKSFLSKDGLIIWVGRSKDENLELTFKHSRGNDLWMHIRGKPGAHVLIPLASGKSAPLETLLDAATLAVYYSGGEKWGKTEVDYTFKKYVKRIKNSTEASYIHNKTLMIEVDPARLKRLLAKE